MIMWSDDKVESPVPLWWSHHPATRSRREWILFGLALIFPSDNTRRACIAGSVFHSATREQCQVLQVYKHYAIHQHGTPTGSLFIYDEALNRADRLLRNAFTETHDNRKQKQSDSSAGAQKLSACQSWNDKFPTVEMGYAHVSHSNFNYKWLRRGLKMWQMENISFGDSFAYTKSRVFSDLYAAYLWQMPSYGAGWFRRKELDEERRPLHENTVCNLKTQLCPPSEHRSLHRTFIHLKCFGVSLHMRIKTA